MPAKDPCRGKVSAASKENLSEQEAGQLLDRMRRLAEGRAKERGQDYNDALRDIAGELKMEQDVSAQVARRNMLLDIRARREAKSLIKRFSTIGEGVLALLEGSSKRVAGGRRSIDYQAKALHGKYIGRLVSELESAELLTKFRNGELSREVYVEMGEIRDGGRPGLSGSKDAQKIATIVQGVTDDMVGRQNRAGAYINKVPGYVTRQTHDMDEIRRAGGPGNSPENRTRSFSTWYEHTFLLLDPERTFRGADPLLWMRNVHEALYTGVHGPDSLEAEVHVRPFHQDVSRKVSSSRVLHFKDADSAWQYNERFGIRSLKDQVFSDVFYRSRSIAMMENLGPSAGQNFEKLLRELQEEARIQPDAAKQIDSLGDWRIQAAFDTVSGKADIPVNYTLSRAMNIVRSIQILSKMGGTLINALSDKAFLGAESSFQGISRLDTWGAQVTGMLPRSGDQRQMLRLMGVAMDGIIGNTISRYTSHATVAGTMHKLQQKLFDINFMNWWTDTNKATMAELMSAHLGEHSGAKFSELPGELSNVLSLYNITPPQWDAIRSTAWTPEGQDTLRISPDQLSRIPDDRIVGTAIKRGDKISEPGTAHIFDAEKLGELYDPEDPGYGFLTASGKFLTREQAAEMGIKNHVDLEEGKGPRASIADILNERNLKNTPANRQRVRDELDTSLRTYFADRVDYAVPTPGAHERRISHMGTRPGTPLGEAVRMVMMFKAFPITVLTKIMGREIGGSGSPNIMHWALNNHKGKFHTAQLIAMTIAAGYLSGAIRDALKGRKPKPLTTEDGVNSKALLDAAARGGGLGIMGDYLFHEYDRGYRSALTSLAGPVVSQVDPAMEILTLGKRGEADKVLDRSGKLFRDNTPFINLFYTRPVLDYFIFWNLQEMTDPSSLRRTEEAVMEKNKQEYFLRPSETVR